MYCVLLVVFWLSPETNTTQQWLQTVGFEVVLKSGTDETFRDAQHQQHIIHHVAPACEVREKTYTKVAKKNWRIIKNGC